MYYDQTETNREEAMTDYHELHWEELMTEEEFVDYARKGYSYWEESLGEAETQYKSECALYGDAGPGQLAHINDLRHMMRGVCAAYKRITGDDLPSVAWPVGWEDEECVCV